MRPVTGHYANKALSGVLVRHPVDNPVPELDHVVPRQSRTVLLPLPSGKERTGFSME